MSSSTSLLFKRVLCKSGTVSTREKKVLNLIYAAGAVFDS
jgi:hypothetical protein